MYGKGIGLVQVNEVKAVLCLHKKGLSLIPMSGVNNDGLSSSKWPKIKKHCSKRGKLFVQRYIIYEFKSSMVCLNGF